MVGPGYQPFVPARRPGGRPDEKPRFRVLVHHKFAEAWNGLPGAVGLESAQQFYEHVSQTPGEIPQVNSSTILKGKAGKPKMPGFSRTVHYEISGAGRVDYQWNSEYQNHEEDEPHPVVLILSISLGSH